ncbi:NAD(P)H-dependent oxidoreductase subunit E [Afipia sp. 1NLS2]|uniref:NAD(P)H-dependent oxidoreductase subunit E n=1 Tax=Afipia sp. 1NLS2 TaxID=666684 RepID=UPI0001D9F167|nr:NAD(P)H-dependent oxidoreductase subunit E [Afipia sp. 1NLS2]EFI50301.1 Respiratory-chain NADH dehydrogenase domain 51 kDa subunit [Afipia sp. 1NLS2]
MDLKFSNAEPFADERDAVDRLLGTSESGWHGGERDEKDHRRAHSGRSQSRRHLVMEALHAVNDRVGWISPGALNYIGKRLGIAAADVYSVATFYAMFSTNMRPKRIVHVCTDIACMARGSKEVCADLEKRLGPAGAMSGWKHSPCLGVCERAPAALAVEAGDPPHEHLIGPATADEVVLALNNGPVALAAEAPPGMAVPQAGQEGLMLLKRVGKVDPESIDDYLATGGYAGLRRAFEMGPGKVISEVKDSRLMGRGGAAFPAGIKWESTAKQPATPRYLVCNADESEPGTFKDRAILEGDPFALIESMTIAGYAISAERGYIYLRGEYPRAYRMLSNAIARARGRGFLGDNVMGTGWSFELEIRRGAGAYICGEETAIFNSIEGYRGEPRSKPPFPFEAGLFNKPTVVNNVETLCNVPLIMQMGGAEYAKIGTEGSTGPKLFCVSGNLVRPGVYEVPFGATLGDVIKLAGGVPQGRKLQAVLLGGAAGVFVRADELHIPLTFEGARANNATLGSGVVLAFDDTVDLPAILLRIASFFRDESCGQCVPCRVGTVRQEEALLRIMRNGRDTAAKERNVGLLRDVGLVMKDSSICGLGQAAWNAVESAIDRLGVLEKSR